MATFLAPINILVFSLAIFFALCPQSLAQSGNWVQFYRPAQEDIRQLHWTDAERHLKQAMPFAEGLGEDDIRFACTIGDLGRVYVAQNRYMDAEPLLTRALDLMQKADYKDQDMYDCCLSLQDLLIKSGRNDEALKLNDVIKKIVHHEGDVQKAAADPWQKEYDSGMKNYNAKRFADADNYLQKSLQIAQNQIGAQEHLKQSLAGLYALNREEGKYSQVESYFLKLKPLISKINGPKSEALADLYDNYADVLEKQKKFSDSGYYKNEAERIRREILASGGGTGGQVNGRGSGFQGRRSNFVWNSGNIGSFNNSFNNSFNRTTVNRSYFSSGPSESYLREADIARQTQQNAQSWETRSTQAQILNPSYMSRYNH